MERIDLNNKTILVTGGAGFIGSNLIKRLFRDAKGATIINIDNENDYYDVRLKEYRLAEIAEKAKAEGISYSFVKGDISDKSIIDKLFAEYKFDVVVNLAAQPGDVPTTYADATALERDFGFTPKITLRAGLRKFAEWYAAYYVR